MVCGVDMPDEWVYGVDVPGVWVCDIGVPDEWVCDIYVPSEWVCDVDVPGSKSSIFLLSAFPFSVKKRSKECTPVRSDSMSVAHLDFCVPFFFLSCSFQG